MWKKYVYRLILIVFIAIMIFIVLNNALQKNPNTQISVTAYLDSGNVTFRGATIDGEWWGPDTIVSNSASWARTDNNTFTAVDEQPLLISLPEGKTRTLTFNAGPNEGKATVNVEGEVFEFDFKNEITYELGYPYDLPDLDVASRYEISVNTVLFILVVLSFMIFVSFYLKQNIDINSIVYIEKSSSIEIMRFLIIMCVVIHHYNANIAPAGYLGVDFFFLLSGFLLMQHYETKQCISEDAAVAALKYTKGRYFRLIPYYLFSFVFCIFVSICLRESISISYLIENNIWELLMLDGFGLSNSMIVGTGWYCSSLIIVSFVIYFLLTKCNKTYLYFVAPISFFVILGWMYQNIGHLNRWTQIDTFTWTGNLRGFAELGFGCICYKIYTKLKSNINDSKDKYTVISTFVEILCVAYIFYTIFKIGKSHADFICVLFMSVLIISLFLGNSYISRILKNKVVNFLGTISVSIYLLHPVLQKINWYNLLLPLGFDYKASFLLYLVIVVIFSGVSTVFINRLLDRLKR